MASVVMFSVGDVLAGKYRVERVLGQGGMGYVVAALHLQLDQRVAVKLMMPELCEERSSVERFLREARASVRIQSEHVARVLDVGTLDSGEPFMVMEFLSGHDLSDELEKHGTLTVTDSVDYVLQACEALAVAHSLGIIHRDLKPANLFLTQRPDGSALVKVLDFGISKALFRDTNDGFESLTSTQSLVGSPRYMSPEQARKPKTVDVRSDIWSLGIILYEFLSGDSPFTGDSALDLLAAIVTEPLPNLRKKRPDVPEALTAIIAKCLEKQTEDRYRSVAELAHALAPFASEGPRALVGRISGILRSVIVPTPRSDIGHSQTLRSEEPSPSWAAPTQTLPLPAVRGASTPEPADRKQTQTGFGHSQPNLALRSKRRTFGFVALAVGLLVGVYLLRSRTHALTDATDAVTTTSSPEADVRGVTTHQGSQMPAAPSIAAMPVPSVVPLPPSASASAAPPTSVIKPAGKEPSGQRPVTPLRRTLEPMPAPAPGSAPLDPLDGRR